MIRLSGFHIFPHYLWFSICWSAHNQTQKYQTMNSECLLHCFCKTGNNMVNEPRQEFAPVPGETSCSKKTISMHYVSPEEMHLLEFLIYRLRLFWNLTYENDTILTNYKYIVKLPHFSLWFSWPNILEHFGTYAKNLASQCCQSFYL